MRALPSASFINVVKLLIVRMRRVLCDEVDLREGRLRPRTW